MEEEKQTTEVRTTASQNGDTSSVKETIQSTSTVSTRVVVSRIIWFIAGLIAILLALRFVLMLLGANHDNSFVDFIYQLTAVFAWPFFGIFGYEPTYGTSVVESGTLVAIIVYLLVGWGLVKLINIASPAGEVEQIQSTQ